MLKSLLQRLKGAPSFYEDVRPEQVGLYQHYVTEILRSVNVENNTKWSRGDKSYDRELLKSDDEKMEQIIVSKAAQEGLSPTYLQIMVNQYFFADPYHRERDRTHWVQRVLNRRSADYFPDPWAVHQLLKATT